MKELRISRGLTLPIEAVTETFAILGKRGVGKTHTAVVVVEEMLKAGLPVCVLDPVGVWWGLRSSADGKGAGLPIVVLGGEHGDLPLEAESGKFVADLVVSDKLQAVIDLSLFSKSQMFRFVADFAERLYHRNREALHLVLDESDSFAPQKPRPGQERLLGAIDDIVRRGRARGLGVTLITQRSAVLNKDVLTQIEVLIALRSVAPQDRTAIDKWVEAHGTPKQRHRMMNSLASLKKGVAWFWSPGWLGLFYRANVRARETFDSSRTPKVGEKMIAPKKLAPVDIENLRTRMSETLERIKETDPKELRKRVSELEDALEKSMANRGNVDDQKKLEKYEMQLQVERDRARHLEDTLSRILNVTRNVLKDLELIRDVLDRDHTDLNLEEVSNRALVETVSLRPVASKSSLPAPTRLREISRKGDKSLLLLDSAMRLKAVGVETPNRTHVAVLAGMSSRSSATERYFAALIRNGDFHNPSTGLVALTKIGASKANPVLDPPTLNEYHERWRGMLQGSERALFNAAIEGVPFTRTRADLAKRAGISSTSSATERALAWLISLDLIKKSGAGYVSAGPLLFPEGLK